MSCRKDFTHGDQEGLSLEEVIFVSKGIHSESVELFLDGIHKTNMYSSNNIYLSI